MKKSFHYTGVCVFALSLGACSQMQKHSNMLVFGTNTSIGVNVGKDASQTPTIQIGINRQELALVPLLANTSASRYSATDTRSTGQDLEPCPAGTKTEDGKAITGIDISGCAFVATTDITVTDNDENGKAKKTTKTIAKDSYSTLASFGTRTSASGTEGSVAVAQYFATGIAAQKLAQNGGASVIMADSNSGKKAEAEKEAAIAQQKQTELEKLQYLDTAKKMLKNDSEASPKLQTLIDTDNDGELSAGEFEALKKALPNGGEGMGLSAGLPMADVMDTLQFHNIGNLSSLVEALKP